MTPAPTSRPSTEAEDRLRADLEKLYASRHGAPAWQRQEIAHLMADNGPLRPLLDCITAAEVERDEARAMAREPVGDTWDEIRRLESECRTLTAKLREANAQTDAWIERATAAEARAEEAEREIQRVRETSNRRKRDMYVANRRTEAATADRDRLADEVARLRGALTEIAQATPEPDDKEWRDVWNYPAPYRSVGSTCETSVDTSNQGDVEAFGFEQGLHASAVIARRALTATGGTTDGQA